MEVEAEGACAPATITNDENQNLGSSEPDEAGIQGGEYGQDAGGRVGVELQEGKGKRRGESSGSRDRDGGVRGERQEKTENQTGSEPEPGPGPGSETETKREGADGDNKHKHAIIDCRSLPMRPFYEHQWLDVKDSADNWLEAQVLSVEGEDRIKVHYKGWKEKYDEILDLSLEEHKLRVCPPLTKFTDHPKSYYFNHKNNNNNNKFDPTVETDLDVHDTSEKWYSAQVLDVVKEPPNRYQVLISYKNWDSTYDEWINIDSYRLAPLHHHTDSPCDRKFEHGRHTPVLQKRPSLHRTNSDYKPPTTEEERFRLEFKEKGWSIEDMAGDGNCLFRSVSHQVYGDAKYHDVVREKCMDYVEAESSFFANYIDGDVKDYIQRMRQNGEWGDNVEIQAMSEIYGRRVEIYAYSTEPMKTYQRHLGGSNPIRISYHCRSHYNSIAFPDINQRWLSSEPGRAEDQVIAASRRSRRIRPNISVQAQDEELKLALQVSRQEFKRGDNLFDEEIQKAIEMSKKTATDPMQQAVINSLISDEQTQMQRAIQASMGGAGASEQSLMQQAIQASMLDHGAGGAAAAAADNTAADNTLDLALNQAIAASMMQQSQPGSGAQDSDLERVLALSRQEHQQQQQQGTQTATATTDPQQEEESSAVDDIKTHFTSSSTSPGVSSTMSSQQQALQQALDAKQTTSLVQVDDGVPKWVKELMIEMNLDEKRCLEGYQRFKSDQVSEEILKTNIIMYCLS